MGRAARRILGSISIIGLGAVAAIAGEPKLVVERSAVAAVYGEVVEAPILLYPVMADVGRVFRRELDHPGAAGLRLHFRIEPEGASRTWALRVEGRHGGRWIRSGADDSELEFWSDELEGDGATVELFSVAASETVRIVIDRYLAVAPAPFQAEAIVGEDERSPIDGQSDTIREWGRSVARLRLVADDGKGYYCSGFLVARDLLLTNQHCIQSDAERRSARVDFDFDRIGARPLVLGLGSPVGTSYDLDFALFRLRGDPDRHGLPLGGPVTRNGAAMVVIQHPGGEPKQVSLLGCKVLPYRAPGRGPDRTDFGHLCDTLGGSSGSPVIDLRTGAVVGLHHLGYLEGDAMPVNRAVHIPAIVAHLAGSDPDLDLAMRPQPPDEETP